MPLWDGEHETLDIVSDEEPVRTSHRISAALRRESLNQADQPVDEQAQAEFTRDRPTAAPLTRPVNLPVSAPAAFPGRKISPPYMPSAGSRKLLWLGIPALLVVVGIGWAVWPPSKESSISDRLASLPPAPDLALTLRPSGQDLILEWTSNISAAKQIQVDVFDGDSVRQMDLTSGFRKVGAVPIAHKTGNVQVVARVTNESGSVLVRRAGFTDSAAVTRGQEAAPAPSNTGTESSTNATKDKSSAPHRRARHKHR